MSKPYEMVSQIMAERDQLRAELAALKAGQGEAVATISWQQPSCEWTLNMLCEPAVGEGIDVPLYFAPPASADTVSVAPGLERAIQIVREVAKTQPGYSDEREAIFEALSEAYVEAKAPQPPPAPADAVSVPRELLRRVVTRVILRSQEDAHADACDELRALLAQSESKG